MKWFNACYEGAFWLHVLYRMVVFVVGYSCYVARKVERIPYFTALIFANINLRSDAEFMIVPCHVSYIIHSSFVVRKVG